MVTTYNIAFIAYDEYQTSQLTGSFKSLHASKPSPNEIADAVRRILRSYNWGSASFHSVLVYKA